MEEKIFCPKCGVAINKENYKCANCGTIFLPDLDVDLKDIYELGEKLINDSLDISEKDALYTILRGYFESIGAKSNDDFIKLLRKIKRSNKGRGKMKRERIINNCIDLFNSKGLSSNFPSIK